MMSILCRRLEVMEKNKAGEENRSTRSKMVGSAEEISLPKWSVNCFSEFISEQRLE